MHKQEFLDALRAALSGLPPEESERTLAFYEESINDRIEDGATEAEAVAAMGSVQDAAAQCLSVVSLPKLVREKVRPRRKLRAWEIVLLVLGAPAWVPLAAAAVILLLAVYLVIWSIVVTLFALELSFVLLAFSGVFGAVYFGVQHLPSQSLLSLGAAFICAGIAVFGFFLCNASIKGSVFAGKRFALGVKRMFVGKESAA